MTHRYKEIGEIIGLLDSSFYEEFILETDEIKLVLRRGGAATPQPSGGSGAGPVQASSQPVTSEQAMPARSVPEPAQSTMDDSPGVVRSPMVGTFYRAPSPEEPSFVEVGSKVEAGDPLCIIEVMKLFTTIHAEIAGTVTEIAPENAQLVEYGQILFAIDPA